MLPIYYDYKLIIYIYINKYFTEVCVGTTSGYGGGLRCRNTCVVFLLQTDTNRF